MGEALLSGDIHLGCAHESRWRLNGPALDQLTSSGIINAPDGRTLA